MGPTKNPAKHMLFDCVCHKGVVKCVLANACKELGSTNFLYTNDKGNFWWWILVFFWGKLSHFDNK
jgi:hypothetical protein